MKSKKPIKIAILSQLNPENGKVVKLYPELKNKPYIHVAYVDFIKASGANYHLIDCRINEEETRKIYNATDGLLLPGGASNLKISGYAKIARLFRQWAIEDFDTNKRVYPILGICLGFQFLLRESIEYEENCLSRTDRRTQYINLPLKIQDLESDSSVNNEADLGLFGNMSSDVKSAFEQEQLTYNNHIWSLLCSDVDKYKGLADVRMLATSIEPESGIEFVAAHMRKNIIIYVTFRRKKNTFQNV